MQLFDEKRQRYELDFARLKELKREISHLQHGEKKLEAMVKTHKPNITANTANTAQTLTNNKHKTEAGGHGAVRVRAVAGLRGNHLSNTTCLTQTFFKSGESCGNLW